MTTLQKIYRKDITAENVNIVGLYIDDDWKYQKEAIPIQKIKLPSDNAVVIGNGKHGHKFELHRLMPFREITAWGEVSDWNYRRQRKNFFTYGCNALYRNYRPDFLIATGDNFIKEIGNNDYCNENIVYANTKYLEQYPGKFNLIPQNPELNSGAIAAYIAAFDGHKKVYMLGFDGIDNFDDNYNAYADTPNYPTKSQPINEEYWVRSLNNIMSVYNNTEFIRVCPTKKFRQPESWKYNLNYRQIDFRQFVLEVGV